MGMYYCFQCDNHKDNDYHHCEEHPYSVGEMVCPNCAVELEEYGVIGRVTTGKYDTYVSRKIISKTILHQS